MEENKAIFETSIVHNEKITNKYLQIMINNCKSSVIFCSIFEIVMIIFALLSKDEMVFALIVALVIAVCMALIIVVNIKGIKNCRYVLKQYEGALYNYHFYEDHFVIDYSFNEKSDTFDAKYQYIRSAVRKQGLFVMVLADNSLLFIDESLIEDMNGYGYVLELVQTNCQTAPKKKNKKKKK